MDIFKPWLLLLVAATLLFTTEIAQAQTVGRAVDVNAGATLVSVGGKRRLTAGASVKSGDVIQTNSTGQVHLLFDDDTKIVVGPRSTLEIDDILIRKNGRAKRFTINALGGTFRFLSGKSAKSTYKIDTPTATLGIRGTIFDLHVENQRATSVVLYQGSIDFCNRRGACEQIRRRCGVARTSERQNDIQSFSRENRNKMLREDFPYVASQSDVLARFRAPVRTCGNIADVKERKKKVIEPKKPNKPEKPDNPNNPNKPVKPDKPDKPDEPDKPKSEAPGQSGTNGGGKSQGKGNDVSQGQHGTGTGKGKGEENRKKKGQKGKN